MAERWKIYLTIAFIGLGTTPISMVAERLMYLHGRSLLGIVAR